MIRSLLAVFVFSLLFTGNLRADVLLNETFESAGGYTASPFEFTDNSNDYFLRTNGSNINSAINFTGVTGSFFAAQDIDAGSGVTLPTFIDFTGIDISSGGSLHFSGDFAEDDDGSSQDWDDADFLHIYYQIDGGGFQNLVWFENDGGGNDRVPMLDTDFDGTGDGPVLTDAFTQFSASISGSGSLLDLRVEFQLDGANEDIAFDNFLIQSVPEPGALALLSLISLSLAMSRRRHR